MKLINLFKKFSALYLPSSKIHIDCVKGLVSVVLRSLTEKNILPRLLNRSLCKAIKIGNL